MVINKIQINSFTSTHYPITFSHDHIELLINSAGEQLFFRSRDGNWLVFVIQNFFCSMYYDIRNLCFRMPTLRLYHKYPVFLPKQQVDKGAIRFVLSGANIMCPGLVRSFR